MDIESSPYERTLQEAMKLWVIPEIERRKKAGTLPSNFNLIFAQVLFSSPFDKSGVKARLNDEVKFLARCRCNFNRNIKKGETVYLKDIEEIEQIELTEEEKNFAHFTIIKLKDKWVIAFDFRYNKRRARQHIEVARQFIEVARLSSKKKFWNTFVDNLFSAAELLAKSELLLLPYSKIGKHSAIQYLYGRHANLGNVKVDYKDTLNRLSGLRDSARYLKQSFKLNKDDAPKYLQTVEEMLAYCLARLELRTK